MKAYLLAVTAAVALAGCQQQAEAPSADANLADANAAVDANAAAPAGMTLASMNETTWEFTDPMSKKLVIESIDAAGNYVVNEKDGGKHLDHGTVAMKDGKVCFTTAMPANKAGDGCWTALTVAEGQSGETTSEKGEKLTVKRVAYTPLTM